MEGHAADPAGKSSMSNGFNVNNFDDFETQLEELFEKADNLMIHKKKYEDAVSTLFPPLNNSDLIQIQIYSQIMEMDPENIDALNSTAVCIKNITPPDQDFFPECHELYLRALEVSYKFNIHRI